MLGPFLVHSVLRNDIGEEGANAIVQAAQTKPQLTTLCGIKPDQTEANFRGRLNLGDAILLAFDLSRNPGLVKLECARFSRSSFDECLH